MHPYHLYLYWLRVSRWVSSCRPTLPPATFLPALSCLPFLSRLLAVAFDRFVDLVQYILDVLFLGVLGHPPSALPGPGRGNDLFACRSPGGIPPLHEQL